MGDMIRSLKTVRKDLLGLFIFAFVTILFIDFISPHMSEPFAGAIKIGKIAYYFSFSYISAFFFYFLVIHYAKEKDKMNIYQFVAREIDIIIRNAKSLLTEMAKEANIELTSNYPNMSEIKMMCANINPNADAPLIINLQGRHANWICYILYYRIRATSAISKIYSRMQFLDSNLVKLLTEIEEGYFKDVEMACKYPPKNFDMSWMASEAYASFRLIERLELYSDSNLSEYIPT